MSTLSDGWAMTLRKKGILDSILPSKSPVITSGITPKAKFPVLLTVAPAPPIANSIQYSITSGDQSIIPLSTSSPKVRLFN